MKKFEDSDKFINVIKTHPKVKLFGHNGHIYVNNTNETTVKLNDFLPKILSSESVESVESPNVLQDGLVLHLDAGNINSYPGNGTTWYDLSNNQFEAEMVGSVEYTNTIGGGEFGNFISSATYFSIPHDEKLAPTGQITIGAWIYASDWSSFTGHGKIISKAQYGGWTLDANSTFVEFTCMTENTDPSYAVITNPPPSSGWHHVVCTYDGSYLKTFIDTIETSSGTSSGNIVYTRDNSLIIGSEAGSTTTPESGFGGFRGNIAIITVYNKALNTSEIEQNFNADKNRFML
jgi:hypothetical protein